MSEENQKMLQGYSCMMIEFCENCKWCIPLEKYQTVKKENHRCLKYNVRLYHGNYHPNIIKYDKCMIADNLIAEDKEEE